MPIPNYSEALGSDTNLGPGITIIGGNIFTENHHNDDPSTLSIQAINAELAQGASPDMIEFFPDQSPPDVLLENFKATKG